MWTLVALVIVLYLSIGAVYYVSKNGFPGTSQAWASLIMSMFIWPKELWS